LKLNKKNIEKKTWQFFIFSNLGMNYFGGILNNEVRFLLDVVIV